MSRTVGDEAIRRGHLTAAMEACGCRLEGPLRMCWWCWLRWDELTELDNRRLAG